MHLCQDEVNAVINSLPFLEHATRYLKHGWHWLVSVALRRKG